MRLRTTQYAFENGSSNLLTIYTRSWHFRFNTAQTAFIQNSVLHNLFINRTVFSVFPCEEVNCLTKWDLVTARDAGALKYEHTCSLLPHMNVFFFLNKFHNLTMATDRK